MEIITKDMKIKTLQRRKMSNEELLEKAKEAINELFGDMSVSQSTTRENLKELIGDIEVMLDGLQGDEAG